MGALDRVREAAAHDAQRRELPGDVLDHVVQAALEVRRGAPVAHAVARQAEAVPRRRELDAVLRLWDVVHVDLELDGPVPRPRHRPAQATAPAPREQQLGGLRAHPEDRARVADDQQRRGALAPEVAGVVAVARSRRQAAAAAHAELRPRLDLERRVGMVEQVAPGVSLVEAGPQHQAGALDPVGGDHEPPPSHRAALAAGAGGLDGGHAPPGGVGHEAGGDGLGEQLEPVVLERVLKAVEHREAAVDRAQLTAGRAAARWARADRPRGTGLGQRHERLQQRADGLVLRARVVRREGERRRRVNTRHARAGHAQHALRLRIVARQLLVAEGPVAHDPEAAAHLEVLRDQPRAHARPAQAAPADAVDVRPRPVLAVGVVLVVVLGARHLGLPLEPLELLLPRHERPALEERHGVAGGEHRARHERPGDARADDHGVGLDVARHVRTSPLHPRKLPESRSPA